MTGPLSSQIFPSKRVGSLNAVFGCLGSLTPRGFSLWFLESSFPMSQSFPVFHDFAAPKPAAASQAW